MDYEEEQQMELEALGAILGEDDLPRYTGSTPGGWSDDRAVYKLHIDPDAEDLEAELSFELLFQHTATYPETEPFLKVSNPRGLNDSEVARLTAALHEAAAENVGMASVFAVMQAGKEWLETKAGVEEAVDPAVLKKQQEEAEERERIAQRAQGTPVTVQSFNEWRARFEAEMAAAKEAEGTAVSDGAHKGMTGKQWFMARDTGEDAEDVEALEDELAELDLEEDESEGEDEDEAQGWQPGVLGEDEDEDDDEDDDEDFLDDLEGELEA